MKSILEKVNHPYKTHILLKLNLKTINFFTQKQNHKLDPFSSIKGYAFTSTIIPCNLNAHPIPEPIIPPL